MKSLLFVIVCVLGLAPLSAQQQQVGANNPAQVPTTATSAPAPMAATPEYTGVFYLRGEHGELISLPHKQPKVKVGLSKYALLVGTSEVETSNPTFVVRLEGTGDPSQVVRLVVIEDGKIQLKKDSMSSFVKVVDIAFTNLGNRTFEVKPVTGIPQGDYAIAVKPDNPLAVPECFIVHVRLTSTPVD